MKIVLFGMNKIDTVIPSFSLGGILDGGVGGLLIYLA